MAARTPCARTSSETNLGDKTAPSFAANPRKECHPLTGSKNQLNTARISTMNNKLLEGLNSRAGREKYNAALRVIVRASAAYTEFPCGSLTASSDAFDIHASKGAIRVEGRGFRVFSKSTVTRCYW